MKIMTLLTLAMILATSNAYASGGFDCMTTDKSIEIYATTASAPGNPLISVSVIRNGQETDYSKELAVGYWNLNGEQLKLALADEEYSQLDYQLEAQKSDYVDGPFAYGSLKVAGEEYSYDVDCSF